MIGKIVQAWKFEEIVQVSGYRNVVTMDLPPVALIHDGSSDERRINDGVPSYFIGETGLATEGAERAQQVLERLYALGDWAAGEVVERQRREQERLNSGYYDLKPRLTIPQMLVRRFLKANPDSSSQEIASSLGLAHDEVSEVLRELCELGVLVRKSGTLASYDLSDEELARYQSPLP